MTRRQWTGLGGLVFGVAMFVGIVISGSTPDNNGPDAAERYTAFWNDSGHASRAVTGTLILSYAWVLLACFAGGLRRLLPRGDDTPLRTVVLTTGAASAAVLAVGSVLVNSAGLAADQADGYEVDGNDAILLETTGYFVVTMGMMLAAAMAVAFSLANRRARVVPQWTTVLTVLLALAGLGTVFTAWLGFVLLPLWSAVIGVCLLARPGSAEADVPVREMSTAS